MTMLSWWQHLPEQIDPVAFTIGFFAVHWYALFWLLGAFLSGCLFRWLVQREKVLTSQETSDIFFLLCLGVLVGARLGYALWYQPAFFLRYPLAILWPFDPVTGAWSGLSGMSFFGGLFGGVVVFLWQAKKKRWPVLALSDVIALSLPPALFCGRLGNFFNGELFGRITTYPWGMIFPRAVPSGLLRHPSMLYEALLEGLFLFLLLSLSKRSFRCPGAVSASFLLGYGLLRFCIEYVREPDFNDPILLGLTRGQEFSGVLALLGSVLVMWLWKKKCGKLSA